MANLLQLRFNDSLCIEVDANWNGYCGARKTGHPLSTMIIAESTLGLITQQKPKYLLLYRDELLINGLMQQIFVANPKGGCGKTMLSVHLASYFARQGRSVALCDHDPQRSSLDWLRARPAHLPPIDGIEFFQHQLISNRYDIAIHDAPAGHGADELMEMVGGHQLIIPVLPSATDIRACVRYLMALNRSGVVERNPGKIGLVANRVNLQTNYFKVLLTFLNEVNLPIVGYLRDTQNYIRAVNAGVSLFDLPPSAIKQDTQQWQPILEWLAQPATKSDNPLQDTINELLGL